MVMTRNWQVLLNKHFPLSELPRRACAYWAEHRMHSGPFWVSLCCQEKQGSDGHTETHVSALCRAVCPGQNFGMLLLGLLLLPGAA